VTEVKSWSQVTPVVVSELVKDKLLSLNDEAIRNLRLSKRIKHPGEGGRARENAVSHFLETLIPTSFSVSTGFIIDAEGNISPQIDIIITRQGYHPVLEVGGIKHFLLESVHAVFENKARIDSKAALGDALEKIRFVRGMDRTNRGKNYTMIGGFRSDPVQPDIFSHQVMGGIITEKSLSKESFLYEMKSFRDSHPRTVWPSFYADVNHFTALYLRNDVSLGKAVTFDPHDADEFYVTDREKPDFVPPLVEAGMMILSFLRTVPVIDYSSVDYILPRSASGQPSDI